MLVVEDEPDLRELLADRLRAAGCRWSPWAAATKRCGWRAGIGPIWPCWT
ncbi:hypothetical protein [Allorhizocola rhizosphaerae]|nr:hypothetical protein [Allorhizocola rhizosphaerae]